MTLRSLCFCCRPAVNFAMDRKEPRAQEDPSTSDDTSSDESSGEELATGPLKKKRGILDYSALSRHGYSGGLSVLKVPLPKVPEKEPDWSWSTGKEKNRQAEEETYKEREQTAAAASGEKLVNIKKVSNSQTDRKDKGASFSQKEKRKRDLGQASRGKSYVEEEKRLLRESGVYSGFDS